MGWFQHYFGAMGAGFALAAVTTGALVLLEMLLPRTEYPLRARLKGVIFTTVSIPIVTGLNLALRSWWAGLGLQPLFRLELSSWFAWAGPASWLLIAAGVVLVSDFFGYWYHRIQHGPLWPFHAVHHSVEELHVANNFSHPGDAAFQFLLMAAPMSLIPFGVGEESTLLSLLMAVQLKFIHCPVRFGFGPLRYLVCDNVFHRVHHSIEPRHFGKNYGTLTTVWDQLFGTAYFPAKGEWPATGLSDVREPRSVRELLDFPWRYRRATQAFSVTAKRK